MYLPRLLRGAVSTVNSASSGARRMSTSHNDRMIWIDCEMTGLDVEKCTLVEIACIVSEGNSQLDIVAEGPDIVIHQPDIVLDNMTDWCRNTFTKNHLLTAIRQSDISLADAEHQMLAFVQKYTNAGECPLAGNTVSMDRQFIERYMPRLAAHFHYRTIDVSSVKELCRRWYPTIYADAPKKALTHRALDDIRESISELRYYQSTIFK